MNNVFATRWLGLWAMLLLAALIAAAFILARPAQAQDRSAPFISTIAITSDAGDDDTYGGGDIIVVRVTFDEPVNVSGDPTLALDFDGTAKTAAYQAPVALGGPPGTPGARDFAIFHYTVKVGDEDTDGIAIGANALSLNDGTIQDRSGNDAKLGHPAVPADSQHKVDAPGGL